MELEVETTERVGLVAVTDDVSAAVPVDLDDGLCVVSVQHTTAGIVVNENEPRLLADIEQLLESLAPRGSGYEHDAIDHNADAHLRAILVGGNVSVPVVDGELDLGTWQSILLVECDGPRTRTLRCTFLAG